jgi:hypothetical protein
LLTRKNICECPLHIPFNIRNIGLIKKIIFHHWYVAQYQGPKTLMHEHCQQNIIDAFMTTYDTKNTKGKHFVVEEER